MGNLLFLSADEIRKAASMLEAIDWMRAAFEQLSSGEALVPLRANTLLPDGEFLLMPVHLPRNQQYGVKAVTIHPDNPTAGLPLIHALITVFDGKTGQPRAVMDGEYLTALRTGAASGLATQYCALPNADVAAIFGAGAQAATQLEAVHAVRPLQRALVFSRTQAKAETFCAQMTERLGIPVTYATDKEAIRETAIICTATTSCDPLFPNEVVQPGTHLNAVGGYRPDMAELPGALIARSRVITDQHQACLAEAGDLVQPLQAGLISADHLVAELGEVSAGLKPGRTEANQITVFKSVGNAAQDLAAAGPVLAKAEALGLGTRVPL